MASWNLYISHRWLDVNPQEGLIRILNHERIANLGEASDLHVHVHVLVYVCFFFKSGCSSGTNLSSLGLPAAAGTTNDNPPQGLVASIYDVELNL